MRKPGTNSSAHGKSIIKSTASRNKRLSLPGPNTQHINIEGTTKPTMTDSNTPTSMKINMTMDSQPARA